MSLYKGCTGPMPCGRGDLPVQGRVYGETQPPDTHHTGPTLRSSNKVHGNPKQVPLRTREEVALQPTCRYTGTLTPTRAHTDKLMAPMCGPHRPQGSPSPGAQYTQDLPPRVSGGGGGVGNWRRES